MGSILPFVNHSAGPLVTYAIAAADDDIQRPLWPGLWELDYPEDKTLSPYLRFGINNGDGEHLAVWRAAAWAMVRNLSVCCIPMYYRDDAASMLSVSPERIRFIDWEYEVDNEKPTLDTADEGFVPGRSCVPIRPQPTEYERSNAGRAGLFDIYSFDELTLIELAVAGDATSEIALFGLAGERRRSELLDALRGTRRPVLNDVLGPNERFVDLSVVRDRFGGLTSYFIVRSFDPNIHDVVRSVAAHFDAAWEQYVAEVSTITTFEDFGAAMGRLLAPT